MKNFKLYLKKNIKAYLVALTALLFYELLDMISPQVTKCIIDDVIGKGEQNKLLFLLLMLAVVGVGRVVMGYLREFTFDKVSFTVASDIRKDMLRHIQKLSVDFFDKTNTGEIMARIKDDVDKVQIAFGFIGMLGIQIVIHTAMILYFMFNLSAKLSIFPLIAIPLCGVLAILMERRLNKVYEDISDENSEMNTVAEENLAGVRTVKAFAREKYEIGKFLKHNKKYYDLNMNQSKIWIRFNPIFQFVTKLLPLAALLWGGSMVISGEITLGTLGAFVEYCNNAIWPMEMLGWITNEIASAIASKKKLDKITREVPMITDTADLSKDEETITGHITFNNVSLQIEDKDILKNISFDVQAGHTLGIMGATGSGKSSIINMLMRFYDCSEGSVCLDGTDIRELPLKTVRKNIATAMQDVFLFSDTIAENVKLGKKNAISDDVIREALTDSEAIEFVNKLSDGIETEIGERGVGLSGGQKQRISMARAFAKKAPVLVLDDSTSALDTETEQKVQEKLKQMQGATKLIISHRISSVCNADEIIVLDKGEIVERGSHSELMSRGGYYYQTYRAQYGA